MLYSMSSTDFQTLILLSETKFEVSFSSASDDKLCRVFNNFFSKTVDELKIPNISDYRLDNTNDPLKETLKYLGNHSSITNVKIKVSDASFIVEDTSSSQVIKLIKALNIKRLLKRLIFLLRLNNAFSGSHISKKFNNFIEMGEFPCVFKHIDFVLVHKKEIKSNKANYRPIITLLNISKIYEQLIYEQLYKHFN